MDSTEDEVKFFGQALNERDHSIQLGGSILSIPRPICAFFKSSDDEYRVLLSFIKDGFACGEKAFHITNPINCGEVR